MVSKEEFKNRRKHFFKQMEPNSVAILFAAKEQFRTNDINFPYRQDSNFYYLTGFEEPESMAVFLKEESEEKYILFNRPRDPEKERWIGYRAGQEGACNIFGADISHDIHEAEKRAPDFFRNKSTLYYAFNSSTNDDHKVHRWLKVAQGDMRAGMYVPSKMINVESIIHEMRIIKSDEEIKLIRRSCEIDSQAQKRAMRCCKSGMMEYQLAAELHHEYEIQNGRERSFGTIAACGKNASTLHYDKNSDELKDGELVLIDAGCEYQYYASDITRTFPVNGKFTEAQRLIYALVLKAQESVIEQIKPGAIWHDLQKIAVRIITDGLLQLGLLKGESVDALIEKGSYKSYYMHHIGHWLGLDAHDCGTYRKDSQWRKLQSGMVLTVEPGIYILENKDIDDKFWNIGVRIEDDILVTKHGHENLTSNVPKAIDEIEALMA